jgi:hypothetical protein
MSRGLAAAALGKVGKVAATATLAVLASGCVANLGSISMRRTTLPVNSSTAVSGAKCPAAAAGYVNVRKLTDGHYTDYVPEGPSSTFEGWFDFEPVGTYSLQVECRTARLGTDYTSSAWKVTGRYTSTSFKSVAALAGPTVTPSTVKRGGTISMWKTCGTVFAAGWVRFTVQRSDGGSSVDVQKTLDSAGNSPTVTYTIPASASAGNWLVTGICSTRDQLDSDVLGSTDFTVTAA